MKYFFKIALLLSLCISNSVLSADNLLMPPKSEAHERGIKINVAAFCAQGHKDCVIEYDEIKIKISSDRVFSIIKDWAYIDSRDSTFVDIVSNFKIVGLEMNNRFVKPVPHNKFKFRYDFCECEPVILEDARKDITIFGEGLRLKSIIIEASESTFKQSLSTGRLGYLSSLKSIQRALNVFKSNVAKSHQSHLDRYTQALEDALYIAQEENQFTIVNWRVTEASRRLVTFGMVASEILEDYDHVTNLKPSIKAIRKFTSELKSAYGWDRGLVGNVSKASGALMELMEFELTELMKVKRAAGQLNLKLYGELVSEIQILMSKVNASGSGDMAMQRGIFDFYDLWNSDSWQQELSSIIEVEADFKNLVTKKLQIILMAIESLKEMTDMDFKIPTEVKLQGEK
ncbi:hypothetical protein HBN50_03610 [Halobacteriovorax sp. GB3]|uniref:hypothetical protein n=1 Tax=Halobacteriovorax sp. GB3 TaxID=2719615 RepID=UPI00235F2EDC|nr:hypothetical protein [Halobacteriovorax sp. GB3]MDD0852165.1 hypothetical protein [Halobacteriovorax sp. GB3]